MGYCHSCKIKVKRVIILNIVITKNSVMGKSPFKMPGMTFKEDQAPMKKVSFSTLSKTIGDSKLGETGVGEVLTDVTGVIGKGQDFITSVKDKIGVVGDDDADVQVEENVEENIEESIETPAPPPPPEAPTGKYQGEGKINQPFEFNPIPKRNPRLQQEKLFGEAPDWESPVRNYKKGYYKK